VRRDERVDLRGWPYFGSRHELFEYRDDRRGSRRTPYWNDRYRMGGKD
jgi:hypothetical protein